MDLDDRLGLHTLVLIEYVILETTSPSVWYFSTLGTLDVFLNMCATLLFYVFLGNIMCSSA